ncbi:PVC-type heme-binding CxxCH protein [Horticoccus sp. 23ND18S-11]|uniref:PVC-type heme-binding CxxCH protein n=1 Tax=Horticoccus sp. 23ND18S-11 TaxID=3391832 RepID=UPI0039C9F118
MIAALATGASFLAAAERHPAQSPAEALKNFQIEPGLRIELVVAEPLVVNPVAFVFDGPGRLFVAEGRGYPDPVEGGGATTEGRIALLEDVDGDGRFEKRTEFATGLGYVNGITLWRGGVFVTAAPDILYLKDTDGDGLADQRRVVLTGFDNTKTAQIRVSHPTLGFDGKIYVTSGLNGGKVTSPEHPNRPAVVFNLKDGRFDPDTFEFENTSGRAQFGLTFDAYGRRYICSNRHPVLQVMLEPAQLSRNPYLGFSDSTQEVSKVEAEAKVVTISRATISADYIPKLMGAPHAGTFTSASGVTVFGGTGLTPAHMGNVFICESAQNLVQRQIFRPEGASFRTDPPDRTKEFLATADVWFRPVFLGHGPDGALYVADMYRREIDHPRYVPEESRGGLDFESGKDRGRIYRIVKDGPRAAVAAIKRRGETLADLVAALESADEWWRLDAHRRLLERADRASVPLVEKVATSAARPESRARAFWTLRGLKGLTAATINSAMRDPHAGVREQGVQLAAEFIAAGRTAEVLPALLATARDDDPRVRFCGALALGGATEAAVIPALATIALRDGEDRWTRAAVLSGIGGRIDEFRAALQHEKAGNPKALAAVMEHLGRVFGAGASPEACREFLTQMLSGDSDVSWRYASVLGLVDGFKARGGAKGAAANPFLAILGGEGKNTPSVQAFFTSAAASALDDRAATRSRASAIALLGYSDFASAGATLGKLLDARQPPEVQVQAVRALERIGDARGGTLLIAKENWSRYTPQVREAVLATLTAKPPLILVLFDAIKAGVIAAPEISSVRRTQLMKHADLKVRARAEEIFKDLEGGDRMKVYRAFRETLAQNTDGVRGREAFLKACSACHTRSGVGGKVGPDLTGIRNQPADAILLHILVPNYEVAPNYQTVSVVTQDGRSLSGWLAAETEGSLALRTAAGTDETVQRKDITSLTASGVSLMPDGLEQTMAKEDVGNLVAYLKSEN